MSSPSRIRILPDEAVNKVAAGEVVERPAAALKELVENSLDAGAKRVEITLEGSGRTLIRVRDDGGGMTHDELLLSIERHSTSKITAVEDLEKIGTFGFRGEALPSIAAVSRMQVRSRTSGEIEGTLVLMNGGRVVKVAPCGTPAGTEVEVRSLFRNVPARLKFLKSNATELAHCLGVTTRLALAHPAVDFTLAHGKRTLLRLPAASSRSDRIRTYVGDDFFSNFISFDRSDGELAVRGFICRPGTGRAGSEYQHFFVNGRPVRDGLLLRAVKDSCRDYLARERDPLNFYIWIDLPGEEVDVNVHPTKREVRFRAVSIVRRLLDGAIRETLRGDRLSWFEEASPAPADGGRSAEESPAFVPQGPAAELPFLPGPGLRPSPETLDSATGGQLFATYLVALRSDGLVIVDQHAAHERVLYEKFLTRLDAGKTQRLMDPPTIDLSAAEAALLDGLIGEIAAFGIEMERFGARCFRITALPPDLPPGGRRISSGNSSAVPRTARLHPGWRTSATASPRSWPVTARCGPARPSGRGRRKPCSGTSSGPTIRRTARTAARPSCAWSGRRSRRDSSGPRAAFPVRRRGLRLPYHRRLRRGAEEDGQPVGLAAALHGHLDDHGEQHRKQHPHRAEHPSPEDQGHEDHQRREPEALPHEAGLHDTPEYGVQDKVPSRDEYRRAESILYEAQEHRGDGSDERADIGDVIHEKGQQPPEQRVVDLEEGQPEGNARTGK